MDVRDAINDVPAPIPQGSKNLGFAWAKYDNRKKKSKYAEHMRSLPPTGLGSVLAIDKLKAGYVSGNYSTIQKEAVARRYASIEPGKTDTISRSKRMT